MRLGRERGGPLPSMGVADALRYSLAGSQRRYGTCWLASGDTIVTCKDSAGRWSVFRPFCQMYALPDTRNLRLRSWIEMSNAERFIVAF